MVSERVGVEGTARLIQLYALGLTAWALAAPTFGVGGPAALVAAAALGGRLIWLAAKFARRPDDQRGWLSLFLFSNFFLLLLFLVMIGERLVRHILSSRSVLAAGGKAGRLSATLRSPSGGLTE
jgi:heme O synthase-like polyprenyltransferase